MSNITRQLNNCLKKIRVTRPIIHHITNLVTINSCANATSALGASPVMASAGEEVAEITAMSSALVLNMGTPDIDRFLAAKTAAMSANDHNIPIILDPVGVGASSFRKEHLTSLLNQVHPSVIKGNLAEIKTLAGISLESNGGIDSREKNSPQIFEAVKNAAKNLNCVIAITGKEDFITDGTRVCRISIGTEMFTFISGAGCITSSVIGCFLAVEADPFLAAVYAIYTMNICGEQAAKISIGSGDFYVNLINGLFNIHNSILVEEGIKFE